MDKQIVVSVFVKDHLNNMKDEEEHSSIDSVIRTLIHDSEAYRMMKPKTKQKKRGGNTNEEVQQMRGDDK